jgi:uncharacterized protein (TIGR03435 family)
MIQALTRPIILFTAIAAAFAQSESPAPVFDVADVHASPHGVREGELYLHANRLELHGVTMLHLITTAYGVPEEKVFGGPNWLDSDRFEVVAQASTPVTATTFQPMLQALLAERFHLKVRHEDKPEPIYALTATKHVLLKESGTKGDPQCKRASEDGYAILNCQNVTMAYLAERMPSWAPNYFDHPTLDKTGLTGTYDVSLKWTGRGQIGGGDADHPSIQLLDYFEKQLGIKVEAQTRPAASLTVESVTAPTANAPGTAEKLPAPVTEFEVAEIRPSKPDTQPNYNMKNGRLEAVGVTMKDLIGFAYNLDDYMLPGREKWMDTDHFDIIAKAADPSVPYGTLQAMLQTLLAQRFHFKSHFEDRPVDVWALTAPKGKGKLRDTNGQEHAGCTRTPKDGAFTYSCRNTTLAQFADKLPDVPGASGYLSEHPMVDLTGLKGSYDFEIVWSPPARVYGATGRGGVPVAGTQSASALSGGLTVFEAIDRQLGLKLAVEKHSMQVIVIDHIDRTPSEN